MKKLEELRSEYKLLFELEKPYGWMIEDLVNSLYEKNGEIQGNYLTALGLFCYSEVVGREIMYFKNPQFDKKQFKNKNCFNLFLKDYMGYDSLLETHKDIYEWYRHGLCHEYKIKGQSETGVFVYYHPNSMSDFQNAGIDITKGILLSKISSKRIFILLPYLKDFIKGIIKFIKEKENEPNIIENRTNKCIYIG